MALPSWFSQALRYMFEYALVYEETNAAAENAVLSEIPLESLWDSLREHEDFLHLAGFQTQLHLPDSNNSWIMADTAMLKRIFNNIFSNIIKYADKKEPVIISADADEYLRIVFKNRIKTGHNEIESTQIGLKSIRKMLEFMDGELAVNMEERCL